jgi:hypothetical protein
VDTVRDYDDDEVMMWLVFFFFFFFFFFFWVGMGGVGGMVFAVTYFITNLTLLFCFCVRHTYGKWGEWVCFFLFGALVFDCERDTWVFSGFIGMGLMGLDCMVFFIFLLYLSDKYLFQAVLCWSYVSNSNFYVNE